MDGPRGNQMYGLDRGFYCCFPDLLSLSGLETAMFFAVYSFGRAQQIFDWTFPSKDVRSEKRNCDVTAIYIPYTFIMRLYTVRIR